MVDVLTPLNKPKKKLSFENYRFYDAPMEADHKQLYETEVIFISLEFRKKKTILKDNYNSNALF